jgi:hypothetical protein
MSGNSSGPPATAHPFRPCDRFRILVLAGSSGHSSSRSWTCGGGPAPAEQDCGALVLVVARRGDPGQSLHAEGVARPVVAASQQALLLQPGGPVEVTPAPGRFFQRPQRVRGVCVAEVFAAGFGPRGKLAVAGDGGFFVTGQARGVGQVDQQVGELAAAEGRGGRIASPSSEWAMACGRSPANKQTCPAAQAAIPRPPGFWSGGAFQRCAGRDRTGSPACAVAVGLRRCSRCGFGCGSRSLSSVAPAAAVGAAGPGWRCGDGRRLAAGAAWRLPAWSRLGPAGSWPWPVFPV